MLVMKNEKIKKLENDIYGLNKEITDHKLF